MGAVADELTKSHSLLNEALSLQYLRQLVLVGFHGKGHVCKYAKIKMNVP
jgi:hypothetical protein